VNKMDESADRTSVAVLPLRVVPVHDARTLTQGGREAAIVLDGTAYMLRITRSARLILTK